ncbi:MAG: hypothetical protein ACRC7G_03840 [Beijerinckiaceae bacterium]
MATAIIPAATALLKARRRDDGYIELHHHWEHDRRPGQVSRGLWFTADENISRIDVPIHACSSQSPNESGTKRLRIGSAFSDSRIVLRSTQIRIDPQTPSPMDCET